MNYESPELSKINYNFAIAIAWSNPCTHQPWEKMMFREHSANFPGVSTLA